MQERESRREQPSRRRKERPDPRGPFQAALAVVEQKWTLAIVRTLLRGNRRFTELAELIPGLNTRTLAERLRTLEQLGVLERSECPASRRGVEYALTEKGRDLGPILRGIARWGRRWMGLSQDPP